MNWLQFSPLSLRTLLYFVVIGLVLGLVFDVASGVGRTLRRKLLFCLDVFLGPLFSLITFFSALVMTDGELPPLLFVGILFGFAIEHVSIGKWISKGVAWFFRAIKRFIRFARKTGVSGINMVLCFCKSHKSARNKQKT